MAAEAHSESSKPGDLPLPGYGAWSPNELQAKLAEIGAPTQGEGREVGGPWGWGTWGAGEWGERIGGRKWGGGEALGRGSVWNLGGSGVAGEWRGIGGLWDGKRIGRLGGSGEGP